MDSIVGFTPPADRVPTTAHHSLRSVTALRSAASALARSNAPTSVLAVRRLPRPAKLPSCHRLDRLMPLVCLFPRRYGRSPRIAVATRWRLTAAAASAHNGDDMANIIPLETRELAADCYVYKHSTACPISAAAADVVRGHSFDLPVYWVNVIEQRPPVQLGRRRLRRAPPVAAASEDQRRQGRVAVEPLRHQPRQPVRLTPPRHQA